MIMDQTFHWTNLRGGLEKNVDESFNALIVSSRECLDNDTGAGVLVCVF